MPERLSIDITMSYLVKLVMPRLDSWATVQTCLMNLDPFRLKQKKRVATIFVVSCKLRNIFILPLEILVADIFCKKRDEKVQKVKLSISILSDIKCFNARHKSNEWRDWGACM